MLAQLVLFAAIVFAPARPIAVWPDAARALGLALTAAGSIVLACGMRRLGRALTPFPEPAAGGALVTSGVYGYVRHPIYSGLSLAALGWALAHGDAARLALSAVLFVFFDLKARGEERRLRRAYPEYDAYARRVRRLLPWLY